MTKTKTQAIVDAIDNIAENRASQYIALTVMADQVLAASYADLARVAKQTLLQLLIEEEL